MTTAAPWNERRPTHSPELQAIYDRLDTYVGQLRQGFVDELWQRIPAYVSEFGFAAGLTSLGSVTAAPTYGTLEIIRSIVAVVPAGATGIVQLGSLNIPVGPGTTSIAGVSHPMQQTDTRTLTISGGPGGPTLLWLTGEQAPTFGVMGP